MQAPDGDWTDKLFWFLSGVGAPVAVALVRSKTSFATAVAVEAGKATSAALAGYRVQLETLLEQNKQLFASNRTKDDEIIELRKALDALRQKEALDAMRQKGNP